MSVNIEPVRRRRRDRRIDPVVAGLVVVLVALAVAVVKPWGDGNSGVAMGPAPTAPSPVASPTTVPVPSRAAPSTRSVLALRPPSWAEVRPVISRRQAWGIRTVVFPSGIEVSGAASSPYAERWFGAGINGGEGASLIVDTGGAAIVAVGVTFPPADTPLAVRIWLTRADGELEWIDTAPVNEVPARGAYLFLRRAVGGATVQAWEPGRYRVDVLVGDGIRRIAVDIMDRSGAVPDPSPWTPIVERDAVTASNMDALPVGLFLWADGAATSLASVAGPPLDETGAWLDLDRRAEDGAIRSFVARIYLPRARRLGVILPAESVIRSTVLRRLAPDRRPQRPVIGETATASGESFSFVDFAPPGGATWPPGVYALTVSWEDAEGAHRSTWHAELRPGPLSNEPVLLSATRAWTRHAGSGGILLGTPEDWALGESFDGSSAIGCGKVGVRGRPTVIGFVGPEEMALTPVTSTMLFPFADAGPLRVLTVPGAVPGLTLVAPVQTAEFGGPASYGFRAGASGNAPGYTVCIGLVGPTG